MPNRGAVRCLPWPRPPGSEVQSTFKFASGQQGWTAGVSDYSTLSADEINFLSDYRSLLTPLDSTSSALFMSSRNSTDDVFMYYKQQVHGLSPGTDYSARVTVTIATNVPHGCAGAGGQPGEDVWVKAGGTSIEPSTVEDDRGRFLMNIDKGNQAVGGVNAVVLGDIANRASCDSASSYVWQLKTLTGAAVPVRANADGSARLIVGTDSGFEGITGIDITEVDAVWARTN